MVLDGENCSRFSYIAWKHKAGYAPGAVGEINADAIEFWSTPERFQWNFGGVIHPHTWPEFE